MAEAKYCRKCRAKVFVGADGICPYCQTAVDAVEEQAPAATPAPPPAPEPTPAEAEPPAAVEPSLEPLAEPIPEAPPAASEPVVIAPPPPMASSPRPIPMDDDAAPARRSWAKNPLVWVASGVLLMGCLLVGGIMTAIAIPTFGVATSEAEANLCYSNQRTLEGAARTYATATEQPLSELEDHAWETIILGAYVAEEPVCPTDGGGYVFDAYGRVTCEDGSHARYDEPGSSGVPVIDVPDEAQASACYANQHAIETASQAYLAEAGAPLSDLADYGWESMLVPDFLPSAPVCPANDGGYLVDAQGRAQCDDGTHGHYSG